MNIKDDLCKAFCGGLTVQSVPAGYAIGTGHTGMGGDHIGFYVIGPDLDNKYHIQDDGLTISAIEAAGADLGNKSRLASFNELRDQYSVEFDKDDGELKTASVEPSEIGVEALRFMAFLLRVQDLILTSTERTLSTFREEAASLIRSIAGDRASVIESYVVSEKLKDFPADLGIVSDGRPPVALFFGTSELSVMEALLLQSYAEKEHVNCAVITLLETESSVSKKMRQRANNHLAAVPNFRDDEEAACKRIVREAIGIDQTLH